MLRHSVRIVVVSLLAACVTLSLAQEAGQTLTPDEMRWRPGRVPGSEIADLVGDGSKPGLYVQRVKFPANFTVQPHTHPDDRQYTVISGTWYVGWGTTFDPSKLKPLPPGSFYTEPANVPHFVMTKDEAVVVQIVGTAPTATKPVTSSTQ
jgi:quercetin dioxygenase-like cupin family protein